MRRLGELALGQNLRTQRLIERLRLLASAEGATHDSDEVIDLAASVREALGGLQAVGMDAAALDIRLTLSPGRVVGDGMLLERLAGNLIENSVRHKVPAGWVEVTTGVALRSSSHCRPATTALATGGRSTEPAKRALETRR